MQRSPTRPQEACTHDRTLPEHRGIDIVKVADAHDKVESESSRSWLAKQTRSVVHRAPSLDGPELVAAALRCALVRAADVPVAQYVLRELDPGESGPPSRSGADRRSPCSPGLLIPVALVALVIRLGHPTCSS